MVGTDEEMIHTAATRLLTDPVAYERMSRAHNPYGDGFAGRRIAEALGQILSPTYDPTTAAMT